MKTAHIIRLLILAALALSSGRLSAAEKMNVIAILTDDQGPWSMGCYGGPDAVTPNLDRLAGEGALFTRAFVATPVCSPSRATFFTGRYGSQLGIKDWINPEQAMAGTGLPVDSVTWPAVLKAAGWRTALLGKWHLGLRPEHHPTRFGFDHFYGFLGHGTAAMKPVFDFPEGPRTLEGCAADLITDEAIALIGARREEPFALVMSFREPHAPYGPMPAIDQAVFAGKTLHLPDLPGLDRQKIERDTRAYLAAAHAIDRNIGRLLAELEKLGLSEKTIIVFTSDNGYQIGPHLVQGKGNAPWIAGGVAGPRRPNMWDLSLQVPLIIRWPGVTKPGTVVSQLVSNTDTFATLLSMAGVPMPRGAAHEGTDLTPWLRGENRPGRKHVFAQYDLVNRSSQSLRSVRSERWKYVRTFNADLLDELYDLENDPGETRNLIPANLPDSLSPELKVVRDELASVLATWMRSVDDPLTR